MYLNIYFQAVALLYIVLVAIVFYKKKKLKSAENKLYSMLLLASIIGVILDITAKIVNSISTTSSITFFINKCYLLYLVAYSLTFTEYTLLVPNIEYTKEEKFEKYKNMSRFIMMLFAIVASLIMSLPINIHYSDGSSYCYGSATDATFIICLSCVVFWIFTLIFNRKKLTLKKALPIIFAALFGAVSSMIQIAFPNILLITATSVFCTVTMYFTIFQVANPDLEMIEQINMEKDRADRANKSKTEFLSNMSHEIRTPLNAILGFSQGLLEEDIPEGAKGDIKDIVASSDTLLEIVNEILDISKIESKKLEIVNVEYTFDSVYKYLIGLVEGKISGSHLQFVHSCDSKIPPVLYGDYVRIEQIAVNLLTNAIKYTREGHIKLRIDSEIIDKETCKLIISVEDTGVGIKEENLDKIFQKYELEDKKHSIIEGTGLGLALTKRLVALMGGTIKVTSKLGEGSTFTVELNQKIVNKTKEQIESENPTLTKKKFVGHGEKILIVDDNTVNLKVACRLLKYYNLEIELATSGKECISKVANNKYDLVMLDDMMPEMNGLETLQILRQQRDYQTPTIALTANAVSGMKEKYLQEGFNDYLAKPIDKNLLEELLIKYLDGEDVREDDEPPKALVTANIKDNKIFESNSSKDIEQQEVPPASVKEESTPTGNEKGNVEYLKSQGVDLDKALELLGDMEMYNDTVNDFVSEIDNKINDIKKFHDASDMPNYAILVHSLKSDSKYIGLMHLAELAYNHEMASKGNDVNYVNEHYDELMKEANKMIQVIKNYAGV